MFSLDQFSSRSGSQGVVNGENLTCAVLPLVLQIGGVLGNMRACVLVSNVSPA